MLFYILVACFLLWKIAALYRELHIAYKNAPESRRKEFLDLCIFIYPFWFRAFIPVSRAYRRVLEKYQTSFIGIYFESVLVIVQRGENYIVLMRKNRKYWVFDYGASGMIPYMTSPEAAGKAELKEECGLTGELRRVGVLTPADGARGIFYVFKMKVDAMVKLILACEDGTVELFQEVAELEFLHTLPRLMKKYDCENKSQTTTNGRLAFDKFEFGKELPPTYATKFFRGIAQKALEWVAQIYAKIESSRLN